jgi:hypothetical protein
MLFLVIEGDLQIGKTSYAHVFHATHERPIERQKKLH